MNFDKEKEQLHLALDLARIGFYDWNVPENTIVYNKYMLEDWGIPDGRGMTLQDAVKHIHPDDQDRVNQLVNDALENRTIYSTEYRVVRPDGSIVWMDVNGLVEFNDNNEPIRFFGTSINITESKEKALLLAESEAMIRTFADTMPQMAFIADATGAITYFNQRWYDYVSADGTEGWGWKDKLIHHPDDLERTVETWNHSIATGAPYEIDYRLLRHDGEYRWHLGRALPHRNKVGEIIGWCGTNTDIHEERLALERNRVLYDFGLALSKGMNPDEIAALILNEGKKILHNVAGIVLLKNGNDFKIAANDNIPEEYLRDRRYLDIGIRFPAKSALFEGRSYFLGNLKDFLNEFPAYKVATQKMNAKAVVALPLLIQGKAIASVAYYLGSETTFSTDLKLLFESLASQAAVAVDRGLLFEQQLLQKEELEDALKVRDEFLSMASHELKTPLTAIRLNCQLVSKRLKTPESLSNEKILSFTQQNDRSVSKLVRLVDDMLDISRMRTGVMNLKKESFDLCELIKEVIQNLSSSGKAQISLELCDLPLVNWDRLRMEQVISNLVSNAIRYGKDKSIEIKTQLNESSILLSVKDHGIGIPSELLSVIFERYTRGPSDDKQGLGLGLYISKQIIEIHNGKIWGESSLGGGSTFYVSLPV